MVERRCNETNQLHQAFRSLLEVEESTKAQSIFRKGIRMKTIIVSVEGFEETPEGDVRQFACEEHQIILDDNERFLGVALFYKGSEPKEIPLSS